MFLAYLESFQMPQVPDNSANEMTGNSPQFVPLLLAHQAQIYSYIVSLLPNLDDADEVFQETALILWHKFDGFEPGTSFTAWACRIAFNKVLNHRKRMVRSPIRFRTEFLEVVAQTRDTNIDRLDDRTRALRSCMAKLDAQDRVLLERCYQPHVTVKHVAAEAGHPVDTIYKTLRRIRRALLECIHRTLAREEHP